MAKDTIERIIDGASFAPSGHNSQSTEFLVVRDRAMVNKVSAMVIEYLKFEIIGIPPDNNLYGALALGYPIPRFKTMIERKPPLIEWA